MACLWIGWKFRKKASRFMPGASTVGFAGIIWLTLSIAGYTSVPDGFFSSKRHRLHRYWGIRLKTKTETAANWIQKLLLIPSIHDRFLPLQYWVHIPRKSLLDREIDIKRFKQTPLGQDLLHYAPHLFEDEASNLSQSVVNA